MNSSLSFSGLELETVGFIVRDMLTEYPISFRKEMSLSGLFCNLFLHFFLAPGLPVYSYQALFRVEWDQYLSVSSSNAKYFTKSYITRASRLNPSMQKALKDRFGIEPEEY